MPFPSAFDEAVAPRNNCRTVNEAFITEVPRPYGPYASLGAFCESLPDPVVG